MGLQTRWPRSPAHKAIVALTIQRWQGLVSADGLKGMDRMSLDDVAKIVVAFVKEHRNLAAPIVFALAFGESLAFLSLIIPATIILVAISGLLGAGGYTIWNLWDVLL
ncbi:MAG TPA: hypothetical protein PK264_04640, partial [Hyphomicrobiaceae bacterium]|nr:hypothetical protein [Hyphomicrobiaceae bacterium]